MTILKVKEMIASIILFSDPTRNSTSKVYENKKGNSIS